MTLAALGRRASSLFILFGLQRSPLPLRVIEYMYAVMEHMNTPLRVSARDPRCARATSFGHVYTPGVSIRAPRCARATSFLHVYFVWPPEAQMCRNLCFLDAPESNIITMSDF